MDEGRANVEVSLSSGPEKQRCCPIDHDANRRDPDDRRTCDMVGRAETPNGFPGDAAHRHQKDHRVDQGCQNRRAAPSVGPASRGLTANEDTRAPGHEEAENVAQVMPPIDDEGQGVSQEPEDDFQDNVRRVERHTDGEGPSETDRDMTMPLLVILFNGAPLAMPAIISDERLRGPSSDMPRTPVPTIALLRRRDKLFAVMREIHARTIVQSYYRLAAMLFIAVLFSFTTYFCVHTTMVMPLSSASHLVPVVGEELSTPSYRPVSNECSAGAIRCSTVELHSGLSGPTPVNLGPAEPINFIPFRSVSLPSTGAAQVCATGPQRQSLLQRFRI